MTFTVEEHVYKAYGTEKAFCASDCYGHVYWFPRSLVKIIRREEHKKPLIGATLTVDIPDWIIHKNVVPIFKLTELRLVR